MALDPRTVNIGMIVPLTGADVDTWGENALNPDFVALDGLLAGVQTIGVTNVPVTLTAPASYTATPGPGPTQSQNKVLRFTGIMTGNVVITLPLPGSYVIENLTSGAFVLSFRGVTATEVIGTPQGERVEIYNDGANVRFIGLARMGALEHWVGISSIPAWVTACTVKPYLYADGTATYLITDFPALGARLGSTFGGNGSTTFGVPDLRGRLPLAYDGTGTRITVAGCGLNGQTLGAAIDSQQATITSSNQLPTIITGGVNSISVTSTNTQVLSGGVSDNYTSTAGTGTYNSPTRSTITSTNSNQVITTQFTNASPTGHPNVQPGQVTGIWVVKT